MAINEKERDLLLNDKKINTTIKEKLSKSKKVMEGYPLQTIIKSKKDMVSIINVLNAIGRI